MGSISIIPAIMGLDRWPIAGKCMIFILFSYFLLQWSIPTPLFNSQFSIILILCNVTVYKLIFLQSYYYSLSESSQQSHACRSWEWLEDPLSKNLCINHFQPHIIVSLPGIFTFPKTLIYLRKIHSTTVAIASYCMS